MLGTVSAGVLRRLNEQTPAHYRAWVDEAEDDDTPAKVFGRAYHDRVLLPDLFARRYVGEPVGAPMRPTDRSAEHTSELQSLMRKSYAVSCLKKQTQRTK